MDDRTKSFLLGLTPEELEDLHKRSKAADVLVGLYGLLAFFCLIAFAASFSDPEIETWQTLVTFVTLAGASWIIFRRSKVGQVLGIILCCFSVLMFPIGTLVAIYSFRSYISSPELFGKQRIKPQFIKAAYVVRNSPKQPA